MINFIDWSQCTDAKTGHPYYWNIVTKEVTWEMPIEYQQFLECSLARNANSQKKWILCHTDDSAPYYFNEVTREISWEKPDDLNQVNNYPQSSDADAGKRNESTHLNNDELVSCTLLLLLFLKKKEIYIQVDADFNDSIIFVIEFNYKMAYEDEKSVLIANLKNGE